MLKKLLPKYAGECLKRKIDGIGIFWKVDRWALVARHEVQYDELFELISWNAPCTKRSALALQLESLETGQQILVVTTHLEWNPM